jgi:hypothetical protein
VIIAAAVPLLRAVIGRAVRDMAMRSVKEAFRKAFFQRSRRTLKQAVRQFEMVDIRASSETRKGMNWV